jgi:Tfp pilus assembly protein PilZ
MGEPYMTTVEKTVESGFERRKYPRFIKRLPVRFLIDSECLTSVSSDLSESGLFLRTNRGTNVNSIINIQLLLPSNRVSHLKGIVRRTVRTPFSSMKNGMGIEILEKDEAYTHFIQSMNIYSGSPEKSTLPDLPLPASVCPEILHEGTPAPVRGERRLHRRIHIELRGMNGKMAFASYVNVTDISTGGISFEADRRLNIGREYTLSIGHADQAMQIKGTVVWSMIKTCREDERGNTVPVYKAGMQFTDESREHIRELVLLLEKP